MRSVLVVALMVQSATVVYGQHPDVPVRPCASAKVAPLEPLAAESHAGPITPRDTDAPLTTDVQHYHLDLEIAPSTAWLGGSNTMTVRSLVDNLTTFRFRLQEVFTISDLRVGGTPVGSSRLDSATMEVTLDRPYAADEVFELYVAYNGHPSGGGFGSINFRNRGGKAEAWTLSEPWYAYTWWPAKDDLRDKTTADLWFTVPNSLKVASNGVLQGVDDLGNGKTRYRWQTQYPTADYLYCFGTTNYDTVSATWTYGGQTMPLQFYIYPEHNNAANRATWLRCADMLTVFSDLFGPYPFMSEKYGMLEFGWGGAMEHQTMTSMTGFSESTIAHELAHQWWGDNVTCATWRDIWLNEGFATYSEALWAEHQPGSSGEPALHAYMSSTRPYESDGTVYVYFPLGVNEIFNGNLSYAKGAWVLHMLRHVVGDQAFYDTLAAYRALYAGGAATTQDFQAAAEAVTGRDLSWFFLEWIYNPGSPSYNYAWRPVVIDGRGYVELDIEQDSVPLFTMPIDIVTTDAGGSHTHVVWNDAGAESLLFPVESTTVTSLTFDPKPWILWYNLPQIEFVEGPPKIVTMNPAPGATIATASAATIEVVFHKDVVAGAADFALVGAGTARKPLRTPTIRAGTP